MRKWDNLKAQTAQSRTGVNQKGPKGLPSGRPYTLFLSGSPTKPQAAAPGKTGIGTFLHVSVTVKLTLDLSMLQQHLLQEAPELDPLHAAATSVAKCWGTSG